MSHFKYHVFFCLNERDNGEPACNQCGATDVHAYAKNRIKALDMSGVNKVRINKAGCLDRCSEGPVLVVYPEGIWYTYVDKADVDEIIESHFTHGQIVERLRLP